MEHVTNNSANWMTDIFADRFIKNTEIITRKEFQSLQQKQLIHSDYSTKEIIQYFGTKAKTS